VLLVIIAAVGAFFVLRIYDNTFQVGTGLAYLHSTENASPNSEAGRLALLEITQAAGQRYATWATAIAISLLAILLSTVALLKDDMSPEGRSFLKGLLWVSFFLGASATIGTNFARTELLSRQGDHELTIAEVAISLVAFLIFTAPIGLVFVLVRKLKRQTEVVADDSPVPPSHAAVTAPALPSPVLAQISVSMRGFNPFRCSTERQRRISLALAACCVALWIIWVSVVSDGFAEFRPIGWAIFIGAPILVLSAARLAIPLLIKSPRGIRLVISMNAIWIFSLASWGYIAEWDSIISSERYLALFVLPSVGGWLAYFLWRWSRAA
jgi:hypothetical protein